jgi:SAM-dependent methyltransferase
VISSSLDPDRRYDPSFFDWSREMSTSSAGVVVPMLLEMAEVGTVLDVGCGVGAWLAAFADRGISVTGVDQVDLPDAMLMIDSCHVMRRDLSLPLDLGRKFDLVISLEVAEHLSAAVADIFVDSLIRHGDMVLFSAAIPSQGGYHHLNERWQSYWASLFRERGYRAFDILRPRVWNDRRVSYWYAQNGLLYVREGSPASLRLPVPPDAPSLDVVHPLLWSEACTRMPGGREAARVIARAVRARIDRLVPWIGR